MTSMVPEWAAPEANKVHNNEMVRSLHGLDLDKDQVVLYGSHKVEHLIHCGKWTTGTLYAKIQVSPFTKYLRFGVEARGVDAGAWVVMENDIDAFESKLVFSGQGWFQTGPRQDDVDDLPQHLLAEDVATKGMEHDTLITLTCGSLGLNGYISQIICYEELYDILDSMS